jgi:hypothetical protein
MSRVHDLKPALSRRFPAAGVDFQKYPKSYREFWNKPKLSNRHLFFCVRACSDMRGFLQKPCNISA